MLVYSRKNGLAERHEPTKEQLEEEQRFAERSNSHPRTTTGETTRVVNLASAALDSAVSRSKAVQDSAKSLKAHTAKALTAYKK